MGRDHFINTIIKNDTSFTVNSTLTLNNLTKNDHGLHYCSGVNNVTNVIGYNDTASFNLFVQGWLLAMIIRLLRYRGRNCDLAVTGIRLHNDHWNVSVLL